MRLRRVGRAERGFFAAAAEPLNQYDIVPVDAI
jgi:hypothetical protein